MYQSYTDATNFNLAFAFLPSTEYIKTSTVTKTFLNFQAI